MKPSLLFAALLGLSAAAAFAQPAPKTPAATSDTSPIYGCMLMTPQERADYLARMRAATTPQQREAIRLEHHKQMQERAKQRGVTLPAMPAAGRCPMGAGMGPGMMGPGTGTGPGAGKGMGPGMMGSGTGTGPGTMGPGAGRGMGPGMMGPARAASAATPAPATSTDGGD